MIEKNGIKDGRRGSKNRLCEQRDSFKLIVIIFINVVF